MEDIQTGLLVSVGGSFLNFVSTKIYNYLTGENRNFIWIKKKINLSEIKFSLNTDDLKRKTRIVVIDDEDSFPTALFQSEGYSIDKWEKVRDYSKIESGFYDIIVLDIKGVALHISENDGLGVLESIKKKNPAQIIIAYSQHSFDLSKARFWELADEKIAKPSDFLKIKSIIDNLINSHFKPNRYIDTLHKILKRAGFKEKDISKLDFEIGKLIKQKINPDWEKLLDFVNDAELSNQVKSLITTILKFYN